VQLLNAITNTPWLITPDALAVILDVVQRETLDPALAAQIRADRAARPSALALRQARPLDGAQGVGVVGGVAVVPIVGPIVRRADLFSEVSGLTSLQGVARDIQAALDSPHVEAILLAVDSPGGEVTGVSELAAHLMASRATKPIWAYVEGVGASAAYWLASAAARIVVADTAAVGSIGVVLAVRDPSATKQTSIEFVSSQSPRKRLGPTTEAGRQALQDLVDHTAEVFVSAVAQQRGVSEETVLADFGQGGIIVGRRAVAAGLTDAVGTFEQTLTDLAQAADVRRRGLTTGRTAAQEEPVNLRQMFAAMFGGAQDAGLVAAEPDAPPADTPPNVPAEAAATPVAPLAAQVITAAEEASYRAELAKVLAENERLKGEQTQAVVARFVESAITGGKALPAEREALATLYADAVKAGFGPKVEALISARPAHQLTAELLPADARTLPAQRAEAGGPPDEARRRELLGKTPEGRAVLALERQKA
jgi:signal peptide peptidase SppA